MTTVEQQGPDQRDRAIEDDTIDLSELIGSLIENRYLIAGVTALFFVIAVFYAVLATPVYRGDAMLQIDDQGSSMGAMGELDAIMGTESSSADTEIEIIRSRKVFGAVVDNLNLTTTVEPVTFPLFGRYLARRNQAASEPVEPWMGFDGYAWGGERIQLGRFDVPEHLVGEAFMLVSRGEGAYELFDDAGNSLLSGVAGSKAVSADGDIELFISRLVARADTEFTLIRKSRTAVIDDLKKAVNVAEKGKKTGIITVSMEGADRAELRAVIDEVTRTYLRQNVEQKSQESEQMLEFIELQMPQLKSQLSMAELSLNHYREEKGTIDLSFESKSMIEQITHFEAETSKLRIERAELIQKLTVDHPVIHGIDEKLKNLQIQKQEIETRMLTLPETELESVKLSRDVTVANELYMLLLNRSQELKVSKAGTIGSARIIDVAEVQVNPVKPKKSLIVAVSLMLGFMFGVFITIVRRAMNQTIDDPAVIEKQLGISVYAEIPYSDYQEKMVRESKKRLDKSGYELLAHHKGDAQVIESLRSLRTSLQFALMEAENKVVSISGPAPSVGKSFVSSNFAYLMASTGKKILLIDGDMRKGHLSAYFKMPKNPGLSETLSGESQFDAVVHRGALHENLDFLATGVYPPNPSELLMSEAFKELLASVQEQYELVIIDTPPILAVTDAAIVGQYAATNFMLLRSGRHNLREIQTAYRRFEQNGVHIKGAIFNGVELMKG
ncbi:MAG: polysaccharide biosynthesis tyrosine autokinase, partial [Gammaproteobacteria bacterium]|nr:polysaccharide biosynthesis tyrosine autokinase [Gammaproteobacteria bacterium]